MTTVRLFILISLLLHPFASSETPEQVPLRVLCWNLHHGVGEDGKLDLARIATLIRKAKPDLVALQEIDQNCARSGKIDQCVELARLTGMNGYFGKAMDFDGGAYGQAILSRHPVSANVVHPLPGKGEPRIAFEVTVSTTTGKIHFVTTHLGLTEPARIAQTETLSKILNGYQQPVILCGDFNAIPGSAPLKVFSKPWIAVEKPAPGLTHPAGKPTTEIDHVFLKGLRARAPLVVLPEAIASDHRPLLAEILTKPL